MTEKQQAFLDALFGEARGDAVKAKKIAGYSDNVSSTDVVASLENEIAERTKKLIASIGPKAVYSMMDVLDNPTALGNKDKIAAAKDFLDRAGFKPQDKVEISADQPLFILPPKKDQEEDEDSST